LTFPFLSRKAL